MGRRLEHVDATCKLISVLTSDIDVYNDCKNKGGVVGMSSLKDYWDNYWRQGREQGLEQGREQGVNESRHLLLSNMYEAGMSAEEIARVTAVPFDEVVEIIADIDTNVTSSKIFS